MTGNDKNIANKVVFVHGLNSSNKDCWIDLPRLLRENDFIAGNFQIIDDFNYLTRFFGRVPEIDDISNALSEHSGDVLEIQGLTSLTFVAHSQGGLVSRRYVVDLLRAAGQRRIGLPIIRILTFATPHLGSYPSGVGKILSHVLSQQVTELAFDSASLSSLNQAWSDENAENRVEMLRVIAGKDGLVPEFSARGGLYGIDLICMQEHDHRSCTKVNDLAHPAYNIAFDFISRPLNRRVSALVGVIDAPVLNLNLLPKPIGPAQKIQFNARRTEFIGRETEMEALLRYCLLDQPRSEEVHPEGRALWGHIRGAAGVGKSRLALELCLLLQRQDWHAGFLANKQPITFNWSTWQPVLPTLIVIDYATSRPDELKEIFEGLFNRNQENFVRHTVRFLLIDRLHTEGEIDKIVGVGSRSASINNCRYIFSKEGRGDLDVGFVPSGYNVFVDYWNRDNKASAPSIEAFSRVMRNNELEPGNPLHVGLAYQIIGKDFYTNNARNDKSVVLDKMIEREVAEYWKPIAKEASVSLDDIKDWMFLASITGGVSRQDISKGAVDVKVWPRNFGESFMKISSFSQDKGMVHPLQPHLIAERFSEKFVRQLDGGQQIAFIGWALTNAPKKFASFYFRLKQDFPVGSEFDRILLDLDFKDFAEDGAGSLGFCLGLMTALDQASSNKSKYYLKLLDICEKWPGASDIHKMAVMATTNIVSDQGERDPIVALEYLKRFKSVSVSFASEIWFVKDLSTSLFNIGGRLSAVYGPNDERVVEIIENLECLVGKFSHFDEPIIRLAMLHVSSTQFAVFDVNARRRTFERLKEIIHSREVPSEVYYQYCLCISHTITASLMFNAGGDFWNEFTELEGVVRMGNPRMIPPELLVNLSSVVEKLQESEPERALRVSQTLASIQSMFSMLNS